VSGINEEGRRRLRRALEDMNAIGREMPAQTDHVAANVAAAILVLAVRVDLLTEAVEGISRTLHDVHEGR